MDHAIFEIVTTSAGAISIRNKVVNEIMHNPVGPWVEANALYIEQSKFKERLLDTAQGELVVFDVGLGAAANALAALHAALQLPVRRPLRLVSFERDLELLRFALDHADQFDHFRGFENALEQLLLKKEWTESNIHWELRYGEFPELIRQEIQRPHLIFFDPYSPKVNKEMWTAENFRQIRLVSRELSEGGTILYTYSLATKIRAAMIAVGFYVGYGRGTGLKAETTQAATHPSLLESPLNQAWFGRWQKSHDRYPFDCTPDGQAEVDLLVTKQLGQHALAGVLKA